MAYPFDFHSFATHITIALATVCMVLPLLQAITLTRFPYATPILNLYSNLHIASQGHFYLHPSWRPCVEFFILPFVAYQSVLLRPISLQICLIYLRAST